MNTAQSEMLTMGTFLLDDQEFGVDLLQQREVLRMMPVTRMPCGVDYIEGVINLRGEIIPIVNLRKRLGMPGKEFDKGTRILNIEVAEDLIVGLIVDSVGHVRRMEKSMIEPAPPVVASVESEFIYGVGKLDGKLLIVLDVPKVLSDNDLGLLKNVA